MIFIPKRGRNLQNACKTMFYFNKPWKRNIKQDLKLEVHDFRTALRNYIDVLYTDPDPESLKKAYKELKTLMPDIEDKLKLKVL